MEAKNNQARTISFDDLERINDEDLMMYISMGNAQEVECAQKIFFQKYYGYMRTLAKKQWNYRFHPTKESDDIAAECLAKVFEVADTYDPQKGKLKAWIGAILCTLVKRDFADAVRVELNIQGSLDDPDFILPEESILNEEDRPNENRPLRVRLGRALMKLPDRDRELLLDFYDNKDVSNLEGRGTVGDTKAIAERYGLTPDNVRQKVSRSLKSLKQHLADDSD